MNEGYRWKKRPFSEQGRAQLEKLSLALGPVDVGKSCWSSVDSGGVRLAVPADYVGILLTSAVLAELQAEAQHKRNRTLET
jgi:hypothetical protein